MVTVGFMWFYIGSCPHLILLDVPCLSSCLIAVTLNILQRNHISVASSIFIDLFNVQDSFPQTRICNSALLNLILDNRICSSALNLILDIRVCNSALFNSILDIKICNSALLNLILDIRICSSALLNVILDIRICNSALNLILVIRICSSALNFILDIRICNSALLNLILDIRICKNALLNLILDIRICSSALNLILDAFFFYRNLICEEESTYLISVLHQNVFLLQIHFSFFCFRMLPS